jgi:hypothetical protein
MKSAKKLVSKKKKISTSVSPIASSKVKSGTLWPILVVLFLFLVAGSYFWQQSLMRYKNRGQYASASKVTTTFPADTTDWSVYNNTKYLYTFKYPASWQLGEDIKNLLAKEETTQIPLVEKSETFGINSFSSRLSGLYLSFYIFVYPHGKLAEGATCQSLDECVSQYNDSFKDATDWQIVGEKKDQFLGEEVVVQRVNRSQAGWSHLTVFVYKNNNFYILRFTTQLDKFTEGWQEFSSILNTFQFK